MTQLDFASLPNDKRIEIASSVRKQMEFSDLLSAIWRRKLWIVLAVFVSVVITFLIVQRITPLYSAESLIMLEDRESNIVNVEEVIAKLPVDSAAIESEIQVLSSRDLISKLVTQLNLERDSEFNSELRPPTKLEAFTDRLKNLLRALVGGREEDAVEEVNDGLDVDVVKSVAKRFDINQKKQSRVIGVEFLSEHPAKAALIANTFSELYVFEQRNSKLEATRAATELLNERIAQLRDKVSESEQTVERFRTESGLLGAKGETLLSQQIAEINNQLVAAKSMAADAAVRVERMQAERATAAGVGSISEVMESTLIRSLREQEVQLTRRRAELSSEYGPQHPTMVNLNTEMANLRGSINAEIANIVQRIENEHITAQARVATLEQRLSDLEQRTAEANSAEVKLRDLEREAEANRALLNTFLTRAKETSYQEDIDIQQPDARIVSRATVPKDPSSPNKRINLMLAALAAVFISLVMILMLEHLDTRLYSGEQAEQLLGISTYGMVPKIKTTMRLGKEKTRQVVNTVLEQPFSHLAESVRSAASSILLSESASNCKTVLITSALPEEGKSTMATALGCTLARMGRKVIIVDTDLRLPSFHDIFNVERTPGLGDLLMNEAQLVDVVHKDRDSGADFICSGKLSFYRPDILSTMDYTLAKLSRVYDVVLLDTAPIMAVSDAKFLSAKADMTILVIHWAKTPLTVVRTAIKQIKISGGRVTGTLLSMVDFRKLAQYRYGDSYTGQAKQYYASISQTSHAT